MANEKQPAHTHKPGDKWLTSPVRPAAWDVVSYFCEKCGDRIEVEEPGGLH